MGLPIRIMASGPVPKVNCFQCGAGHHYDQVMGWDCLVLLDQRQPPTTIWGAWCDESCFNHWLDSPQPQYLFDEV